MKRLIMMVALVALWCALWQRVSIANVLSGTALAVAIFASGLGPAGRGGVRLVPLLKLLWVVVVDLVTSTLAVAREVIVPEDTTDETVIVVEIAPIGLAIIWQVMDAVSRIAYGKASILRSAAMKVTVDVDCTPEEARRFLGLPDLTPVHDLYLDKMKETMEQGITPDTVDCEEPVVAMTNDSAVISFTRDYGSQESIFVTDLRNGTWREAVRLAPTFSEHYTPSVVMNDAGQAIVAWHGYANWDDHLYFSSYR